MGRLWDGHRLLIRIEEVEIFTLGERIFFVEKEKTGKVWQERRAQSIESGLRVPGSLM